MCRYGLDLGLMCSLFLIIPFTSSGDAATVVKMKKESVLTHQDKEACDQEEALADWIFSSSSYHSTSAAAIWINFNYRAAPGATFALIWCVDYILWRNGCTWMSEENQVQVSWIELDML